MEDISETNRMKLLNFNEEKRIKWEEKRYPYSALIELTPKCNMNCIHCYLQEHHIEQEMSYKHIIEILDILYDEGILFLTFTGGEIFTRKDFIDIYLYAKKRGFMVELFTNGALLTDEIVKVLKKYPPILVDVSIYGASETTYKKITKCHNMFEKVIENCKKMIKNNIRVALRTPVLTYTLDEIEEMRKIADDIGAVFCTSFEISPTIDRDTKTQQYQVNIKDSLAYEVKEYFEKEYHEKREIPESYKPKNEPIPIFLCNMGKGGLVIDYEGNLLPCMKFRHIGKKLTKKNFESIWKSYDKYYLLKTKSDNKCNSCDARYYCEICPAEMDFLYGNMEYRNELMCKVAKFRKMLYDGKLSYDKAKEILNKWN